jgi:Zn-dependent protease/CBS domain-containing protein
MLDRGITVFRIRGIPVRLHPSLLLFLPFVAYAATRQLGYVARALGVAPGEFRLPPLVWGILLAVGLFVAVLIHELAHSLVALRSGVRVRSITLMMLGGVSLMEGDLPPAREAWMALAGPLASFAIAGLSFLSFELLPIPAEAGAALAAFAMTNALLGVFNLLPAFPMDGGRVLRGVLARWMGRDRATVVAARIGKGMAALFALVALWSFNLILLLIAWFVYSGAKAEEARLMLRHALSGVAVGELMSPRVGEAGADEQVRDVLRRLLYAGMSGARVWEPDGIPEHAHRHVVGVVTTDALEGAAERGAASAPVATAMEAHLPEAHPWDTAESALDALSSGDAPAVVVRNADEEVIGLVTPSELRRASVLGRLTRPA